MAKEFMLVLFFWRWLRPTVACVLERAIKSHLNRLTSRWLLRVVTLVSEEKKTRDVAFKVWARRHLNHNEQ